jgi:poly-gamma-glutamate synthesis protein (capsule biosynthesis protein)
MTGGDVCFDSEVRILSYQGVYRKRETRKALWGGTSVGNKFSRLLYRLTSTRRRNLLNLARAELLIKTPENKKFAELRQPTGLRLSLDIGLHNDNSRYGYPLEKASALFKEKDMVMVNLETPLAGQNARVLGHFKSDPAYAKVIADAGITMVNLANNHIYDAGDIGLLETAEHLDDANVEYTGFGETLEKARLGRVVEVKGTSIAVLGYTQYCNTRYASIAASYPGILPLDRELVVNDIKAAKKKADLVFVNLHWGVEDQPYVQKRCIGLAHLFIDTGADAIIGHHPHVPHGIEIYKKKPILYSLGNFIFAHSNPAWYDNFLAELVVESRYIQGVIIYPISGRGKDVLQPGLLVGSRGRVVMEDLKWRSAAFGTGIAVERGIGYISIC